MTIKINYDPEDGHKAYEVTADSFETAIQYIAAFEDSARIQAEAEANVLPDDDEDAMREEEYRRNEIEAHTHP